MAQTSQLPPQRSQNHALGERILRHVPHSQPELEEAAISVAIRRRKCQSFEWCAWSVAKTKLSFFELSLTKPRRCKCHARRAAARRRRRARLTVRDAVALDSEDQSNKDQEEMPQ